MSPDASPSYWMSIFSGMMIGLVLQSPGLRKPIAGMLLLLGFAWLIGGWLIGFDAIEAAIGESLQFLIVVFLMLFIVVFGVLIYLALILK